MRFAICICNGHMEKDRITTRKCLCRLFFYKQKYDLLFFGSEKSAVSFFGG